jgi:PAS domain S-box-containing protein
MSDEAETKIGHVSRLAGLLRRLAGWTTDPYGRRRLEAALYASDAARQQAEAEVRRLSAELERSIAEHTAQLQAANQERERAEQALRESEERYRRLFEDAVVGIFQSMPDGKVLAVNPAFAHMCGYESPAELKALVQDIGKELFADPSRRAEIIRMIAADPTLKCFENLYRRKDGSVFTGNLHIWTVKDENGRLLHMEGFVEDITERKQAEAALRESQERYRGLVETTSDWVWEVDEEGRFTYCSPQVANILGYTSDEALGRSAFSLLASEAEQAPSAAWFAEVVAQRRTIPPMWTTYRHQDGHPVVVESGGTPFYRADGAFVGYHGIARDVTLRKQAEEETQAALAKEMDLNELKSRFISMTSHEFRTPLANILASAELLDYYGHQWTEEKRQQHLRKIQTNVHRMLRLMEDVLLVGKAEAEKLFYEPVLLDLDQLCRDVVEETQPLPEEQRRITFVHDGSCHDACMDETLLRQILTNLLSNAIKYSPPESAVELHLTCEDETALFRVIDQGIGIPSADQPRLFDTFFRGSNVGAIDGHGLGMPIIKKAVELQGGAIMFSSQVGVGTTFEVRLPQRIPFQENIP